MLFHEWNVLIVDDEPDVLSVTKLALRDVRVYGLPLKIYTAHSKAEAIERLNNDLYIEGVSEGSLAVAFIDVVMETQHAGLELCDYIRRDLNNTSAQLYIRTGQPGIVPERDVVDQFDISGYFTKVEATEQKLYTLVKSGIRQWYSIYYARLISDLTNAAIMNSQTRQQLLGIFEPAGDSFEDKGMVSGMVFDSEAAVSDYSIDDLFALHDEMESVMPYLRTPDGHKLIVDGNRIMVKVLPTADTADFFYVAHSPMEMPPALLDITFNNGLALATLWKRAR